MFRWLQDHPRWLERLYDFTHRLLRPFRRWLRPGGLAERALLAAEVAGKGAVFNCQMCGQCVLHSTGMTCPMTCPKNLRNGPCGGVRADGHCEVIPEMKCVWVQAWGRSEHMPEYGHEILWLQPPVDRRLQNTSSWINMLEGTDTQVPPGWATDATARIVHR